MQFLRLIKRKEIENHISCEYFSIYINTIEELFNGLDGFFPML